MAIPTPDSIAPEPIADPKDFDHQSGNLLERLIFNHRRLVVFLCLAVTLWFGFHSTKLGINASFENLIPQNHPYIQNYLQHKEDLRSLGNSLRVVVETTGESIYDPEYLQVLQQVNDTLFLIRGVNRPFVKSIWMPLVRWTEVTEEGFRGGPVMPADYSGTPASIAELKTNVARAGLVGTLVSRDFKSSMIVAPLLENYADTGAPLDYGALGRELEDTVRSLEKAKVIAPENVGRYKVRIIGFGKLAGDLIDGLVQVATYFAIALVIALAALYFYTRCIRSTLLVIGCSLVAVVWQLGLIQILGYDLDPYSMLVPFLIFAIGVSHGAQKMNGIMQDVGRGAHKYVAARYTFRRLFVAGLTAILADVVGFAVLATIDIPVIRSLAVTASVGVLVLVFTNLILLPILLSFMGVSLKAARFALKEDQYEERGGGSGALWNWLDAFTRPAWATVAILVSLGLGLGAYWVARDLQIGDLDAGAPELRPQSRYNLDSAYITEHYGLSSDQFAVIVKTAPGGCEKYSNIVEINRLGETLRLLPEVQAVASLADAVAAMSSALYEASPKWLTISHSQPLTSTGVYRARDSNRDLHNEDCTIIPVVAYLTDHKAKTLERVLATVEAFAAEHNTEELRFLPVAGSAGIEAVTNIVVRQSNLSMMLYVYGAVVLLCFITFRSWRAVLVAVIPLVVTSVMCEALMVKLGIGMKVATLPVVALGVGIGVDYALYLLSVQLNLMRAGQNLADAYRGAILFTGRVVALVGVTLAAGVVTWAFSPIKFQADMGILLTFMFLWNMVGALILIPALSCFLLKKAP
ncbi:MAG: MMPL family transporter [Rhodocyclaceae bacterium]|jgi:predicted RND superfamily exporter protein|nr:MMPL family transporter [Rhodocyclaceae bacterium]